MDLVRKKYQIEYLFSIWYFWYKKIKEDNMDKNNYTTLLAVMTDSLKRKLSILNELFELTRQQNAVLTLEPVDIDEFNLLIEKKEEQLKFLSELDQGFDQLFQKVKSIILENKETYKIQITSMQELIRQISEKGVKIETMEKMNQKEFELFITQKKNQIKNFKMSNKTVTNYYKNIGNIESNSYHLDKRK